jgi:hypothetical protein
MPRCNKRKTQNAIQTNATSVTSNSIRLMNTGQFIFVPLLEVAGEILDECTIARCARLG